MRTIMKATPTIVFASVIALGALVAPETAFARAPAQALAQLREDVARARARDPRAFAAVSDVIAVAPDADSRARGRKAPIAQYLAKLGERALMPALEMLALDPPAFDTRVAAPDRRRDLIEAVGLLRDPRGLPVLFAILEDDGEDAETTFTVTEAIARIGTEEAATKILAALDRAHGERVHAILGGMGECRRPRTVQTLAERLRTATDTTTARIAARSLGRAGNAWAWQTLSDRSDEALIRETAARALVAAFVRNRGEARAAASNALMVVDAPQTPALIREAKSGAAPEDARALDVLDARFARNPARTR